MPSPCLPGSAGEDAGERVVSTCVKYVLQHFGGKGIVQPVLNTLIGFAEAHVCSALRADPPFFAMLIVGEVMVTLTVSTCIVCSQVACETYEQVSTMATMRAGILPFPPRVAAETEA